MSTHFGAHTAASQDESKEIADAYGFKRPEDFNEGNYNAFMNDYLPVLDRRSKRWEEEVLQVVETADGKKKIDGINGLEGSGFIAERRLKRFIRKGIPTALRPKVWMLASGAEQQRLANPDEFQRLLTVKIPDDVDRAIGLEKYSLCNLHTDLDRTFPDNIYFAKMTGDQKKGDLLAVLRAFAARHPDIGYCQGLNYIAGMLLIILRSPEWTFWLLTATCQKLPGYYRADMRGLRVDALVLDQLIREKAKDVHEALNKVGADMVLVTTKWFVCWYLETLPIETVLRIWDCLFFEGPKIIFRVALTLILANRDELSRCKNFFHASELFKDITKDRFALECHHFLENMFQVPGSLGSAHIEQLRKKYEEILE